LGFCQPAACLGHVFVVSIARLLLKFSLSTRQLGGCAMHLVPRFCGVKSTAVVALQAADALE
jgi:hypothetical protein